MEMELLEAEIMSWSAGKESSIRLLLSTLHHVTSLDWTFELYSNSEWSCSSGDMNDTFLTLFFSLIQILWPNSGWYAIPLTNLVENSQVKRAYQKARLCLHPDKLQQRGATMKQKCVAEKAFSVLQVCFACITSLSAWMKSQPIWKVPTSLTAWLACHTNLGY